MLAYKSHGLLLGTGSRTAAWPVPALALKHVLIVEQRARVHGAGRYATRQASRRQARLQNTCGTCRSNRRCHRQLGDRTDDIVDLRAATLPSSPRKIALDDEKAAEKPIYGCRRFAAAAGPGAPMSILSCLHSVSTLPEARSRQQIILPAIHGADDSAPPERPNARARRLAAPSPALSPKTGRPPRTSRMSGPVGRPPQPPGGTFSGRKQRRACRRSSSPSRLRHLYASTALAGGIPITEVSRWLGHNSIEVTHQTYGHLIPSSFDRARTALDRADRKNHR